MAYKTEQIIQGLKDQSSYARKELCDPLSIYSKHYSERNQSMMGEANKIWINLHKQRTNMLFAKENYYSEMSVLE